MYNSISIYNPNQITDKLLESSEFNLEKLPEIPPVMVKQILDSKDMNIPTFNDRVRMVQRLEITNNAISYDYMGSSEFEFGIVGRTNAKIIEWINSGQAVYLKNGDIEIICHISMKEEAFIQVEELLDDQHRLQEPMLHKQTHSNFLCLDNSYFFSIDGNGKKLLMHLKATDELNKHNQRIRKHPKYIELEDLCDQVKKYLKEKDINIWALGVNTRFISRDTFGRELTDKDFEGNIILVNSSGGSYIRDHSTCEQDLRDCLEGKGNMYTDRYYLNNGEFEIASKSSNVNILKSVVEELENDNTNSNFRKIINNIINNTVIDRDFITYLLTSKLAKRILKMDLKFDLLKNPHINEAMIAKIRKSCTTTKTQEKYKRSLRLRRTKINNTAKETIKSIEDTFVKGTFINRFTGEEQRGSQPSRSRINFLNNMSSAGISVEDKDLNTYYPIDHPLAYNQLMIWDKKNSGGRIYTGAKNYQGIKQCIDLEKLTGQKIISDNNLAGEEINTFSFNMHHGSGHTIVKYLQETKGLEDINLGTIFWTVNQIEYASERKDKNSEIERVLPMCKKDVSIEDINICLSKDTIDSTYKYLCNNFPGELPNDQYLIYAQNLDSEFKKELQKLKNLY